ncbi:glycosyltransferase involved in cell wall biosynthesis [Kitasatospora sp. MAP12-15]|uniref:glycosyltransferase family 2 protein n=1 Tax=unclassified Kitasatospora TaxID=2633591 RepID=UPI002474E181|nr:glycosyltransferase family 2 protein [Kitasatospora sp. MAP12-44]MDH6111013.1 glycosyltransferase involved in cell wall biosynthesis [Kitasatospora sp. MAP12-44]
MSHTRRVLIILPAWNEEEGLPSVLREIQEHLPYVDTLVVDDGSSDNTAAVAEAAGSAVARLPFNLGVGGAMRCGYRYAALHGYDVAIQVDADGQHDPAYVPVLLAQLEKGEADLVVGARFAGTGDYEVRGPRKWAMKLLSGVLSKITGTRLTDTTSGFRACNKPLIEFFSRWYPVEYLGDTIESMVGAARVGFTIRQVPVAMRARTTGRPSASPFRAMVYLTRAGLVLLLAMIRRMPKSLRELAPGSPSYDAFASQIRSQQQQLPVKA